MAEKYADNEQKDKIDDHISKTCKICLEELHQIVCELDQCGHIFCKYELKNTHLYD